MTKQMTRQKSSRETQVQYVPNGADRRVPSLPSRAADSKVILVQGDLSVLCAANAKHWFFLTCFSEAGFVQISFIADLSGSAVLNNSLCWILSLLCTCHLVKVRNRTRTGAKASWRPHLCPQVPFAGAGLQPPARPC